MKPITRPAEIWMILASVVTATLVLLALVGCGGVRPPTSCPTGTHGTPPACVPDTPPPPAVVTFPELGLTVQGIAFIQADGKPLDFRGAKACCTSQDGEPDPKWPLVSDAWMDFVHAQGNVNFVGVRLGPWRAVAGAEDGQADLGGAYLEVGGKADLFQWNPAFWARIVAIHEHAGALGERVEVSLIDGWAMKQHCVHGSKTYQPWIPQNNVQGIDACDAQTPGSPTQEAWIRKIVAETGRFHSAVYELSNEGILVPSSPAWEAWVISIVRDEEAKHGFPRHLIGSDAMAAAADFGIVHQNGEPTSSQCGGKPCVNNEYNPSPAFTASQLHGFYCAAKSRGTYYWYWRHTQTKAAMDDTLARIKAGCAASTGCAIPIEDVPQVKPRPGSGPQVDARNALIDEAETFVRVKEPQLFDASGNLAGWPSNGALQSAAAQPYFDALVDYLRSKGYCASSWEDSIAFGHQADGWFEEFHVLAFGPGRPIDGPHAYKFTWAWPGAPPPPPPPPPPGPGPTACAFTSKDVTSWPLEVKLHGGQGLDSTAVACGPVPPCANPDTRLAHCCSLSGEKGNQGCADALFGDATWSIISSSGKVPLHIVWPFDAGQGPNRYSVKVAEGAGVLQLTGSKDPRACVRVHVTATVPPCAAGADGKCPTEACP